MVIIEKFVALKETFSIPFCAHMPLLEILDVLRVVLSHFQEFLNPLFSYQVGYYVVSLQHIVCEIPTKQSFSDHLHLKMTQISIFILTLLVS